MGEDDFYIIAHTKKIIYAAVNTNYKIITYSVH